MHLNFFFISLFLFIKGFSSVCYFIPPKEWSCVDPKLLSQYVNIGFVGKGKGIFNPSINLAHEKTDASLFEYIKAIKDSHKNEKNVTVRELGKIKNQIDGETFLLEISKKLPVGEIILLQTITKINDDIFILTSCVKKEELLKYKEDFITSFNSLKLTKSLLLEVTDKKQMKILEDKICSLKKKEISIQDFEKHLEQNYDELGKYWKILLLKEVYESNLPE